MSNRPSIESIRTWVVRDQESFRLQNEWLDELQNTPASKLNTSYRNVLQQWDRSVVKECNHHLSTMEDIPEPNVEERQLMQELNKLVNLGDHMIDRAIAVQAELEATLGGVDMSDAPMPKAKERGEAVEGMEKAAPAAANRATSTPRQAPTTPATPPRAPIIVPQPAAAPSPSLSSANPLIDESPPKQASAEAETIEAVDPADLYKLLNVPRDATMGVIKKAIKKQTILRHPDKNPGDPTASSRFADFTAACQVFDTEESRAQFDGSGQVERIKDLSRVVRNLTLG